MTTDKTSVLGFVTSIFRGAFAFVKNSLDAWLVMGQISAWDVLIFLFFAAILLLGLTRLIGAPTVAGGVGGAASGVLEYQQSLKREAAAAERASAQKEERSRAAAQAKADREKERRDKISRAKALGWSSVSQAEWNEWKPKEK